MCLDVFAVSLDVLQEWCKALTPACSSYSTHCVLSNCGILLSQYLEFIIITSGWPAGTPKINSNLLLPTSLTCILSQVWDLESVPILPQL